jgi:F-type H+-transporting ATPase subunit b
LPKRLGPDPVLIDWFTVGAQALNFLILVWLMKHFLYKPILKAIDAREQLIAKELADARTKQAEAGKERDTFSRKNQEFDQARAALLTKATEEAQAERGRLLEAARKEADALGEKRLELLQSETRNLHAAISKRTQDEVFAIARKTLSDLSSTSLEERLVAVFETQLRKLEEPERSQLLEAMRSAKEPIRVRSAFELPPTQIDTLQNSINVLCAAEIPLRFETVPEVIGGIELMASGNKVSWSIAEYLRGLETAVAELVQDQATPTENTTPETPTQKPTK